MKNDAAKKLGLTPFRASDHLQSSEECAAYLQACFAEAPDDPAFIAAAMGEFVRANLRVADVARDAGMSREGVYKALSKDGNPSFASVVKIMKAMGVSLTVQACPPDGKNLKQFA
jgi:probable addiction module antidote protein